MAITILDETGKISGSVDAIGTVTTGKLTIAGSAPAPTPQVKAFTSLYASGDLVEWTMNVAVLTAAVDVFDAGGNRLANLRDANSPHSYVYRLGGVAIPGIGQSTGAARATAALARGAVVTLVAFNDTGAEIDRETTSAS